MKSEHKIPSGVVQFMYVTEEIDYPGIYINNEDSKMFLEYLTKINNWLENNMDNTMKNCNDFIDFNKIVTTFEQIEQPRIMTFVETKTI